MKARDIIEIIDRFAPGSLQEDWDNSGLMAGDIEREVTSAIVALDCTMDVVDEAIDKGAQMIITHHPLIFGGLKKIGTDRVQERVLIKIIKNDLVVYSVHTNIDKVPDGVSGVMAEKLKLCNTSVLDIDRDGYGLGIIGELQRSLSCHDFIVNLKDLFKVNTIKTSAPVREMINRVAVCGGSGSSLIDKAQKAGAQVLVTGDISYHHFFCEDGFMIIDIGHFESEIAVADLLCSVIKKKIPNFAIFKSERNNNPIYYH